MTPRIKETKDPKKLIRSAIFALNRKKWSKARRKFEAALTDEKIQQNAKVWANYGITLTKLKLYSEAQKAFTEAVSLEKKNAEIWIKKGLTEFRLGHYHKAKKSFEEAMHLDKNDLEIPILLSRTLRKQDDLKKAIKVLEATHKKFPNSHQIPIELAFIWSSQNEDQKAERVLKKAIHSANHPDPGLLLAQTLLDKKDFEKAILIYEELFSRFPTFPNVQYGLGVAYHANKEWQKALDAYQKAIPLFRPEKPPQNLFINMARVLKNLDRKKEAIEALYQAKKYGKTTTEILLLLSELFLELNRPDRAKRALEDATRLDKYNPVVPFYLGLTLLKLKDTHLAKESFKRTLELDPEFHESKLQLALLAIQEKDFISAFALADDVATADPNNIPGNRLAAKLAYDLRNFKKVIELLKPIVIKDPKNRLDDLELLLNSWLLLSQPEKANSFLNKLLGDHKDLKDKLQSRSFFTQFL
ncbi:MAG: tetratricopeptide repeat protein [Promethearchaeota archaeon]